MRRILIAVLAAFALSPASVFAAETPAPSSELIARAEAGDMDAAEELGVAYLNAHDLANAERWERRAAEAGRPDGMANLAVVLRAKQPDAATLPEADQWEERGIAAGSAAAAANRGLRLVLTSDDNASWDQAFALFEHMQGPHAIELLDSVAARYNQSSIVRPVRSRALTQLVAERGGAEAQWRYAMMLREGRGGAQDVPAAYDWTHRSGEAGNINGIISTAVMLASGEGVAEDDVQARIWYARAAEMSSAHALRALGGMMLTGEGGPPNLTQGWAYLVLAAQGGDAVAQRVTAQYRASMAPEVLRQAEAMRAEWLSAHEPPR